MGKKGGGIITYLALEAAWCKGWEKKKSRWAKRGKFMFWDLGMTRTFRLEIGLYYGGSFFSAP